MVQINLTGDQMKLIAEATKKTEEIAIADSDGKVMVRFARFAKAASGEEAEIIAESKRRMAMRPENPPLVFSDLIHRLEAEYPCGDSQ